MKKSWGEPIVQVQLFVPQEYIAGCYKIITDHPNLQNAYVYINYISPNQPTYNSGERFNWNGQVVNGNAPDGIKGTVDIYDRSNLAEVVFGAPSNGSSYTGFLSGFTKRATEQIKIQGGYAYYWDVNGNVS